MKLIKNLENRVKVYKDQNWNEFRVVVCGNPAATYHTDSKGDALDTAAQMLRKINEKSARR